MSPIAPPKTPRLAALGLLAAALLPLGCGGGDEDDVKATPGGVADTVDVGGSSTVYRISDRAREAFAEVDPKINVIVASYGTGGGFGRYLKGELDVVDASRAAKPDEELKAKTQGIDWIRFLVGYDGIAVVVNAKNDFVKELSVDQLRRLFEPDSKVKTWKDLDPSWPDRKVVIYTPDKDSGTFEFFTEAIVGRAGSQREDVQASADDNILVKGVSGDADGIGYFGFAYFAANAKALRAIAVKPKDGAPAVGPSLETILDKSYAPLARPLYIYAKKSSLRRPAVAKFVAYYLDHIADLTKKAGYVPPTDADRAENKTALSASGGPSA